MLTKTKKIVQKSKAENLKKKKQQNKWSGDMLGRYLSTNLAHIIVSEKGGLVDGGAIQ